MATTIRDWYKTEQIKFDKLYEMCIKYEQHDLIREFLDLFYVHNWELKPEGEEE